jgi:general secretion pathway protein D
MIENFLPQRTQLLALAGVLLLASAPIPAQDPRPAPTAPKGASTPLQAAQQIPPAATPASKPAPSSNEAPAGTAKAPALKPGEVLLNFQAAEIQGVVKAVGQMTGRNFLLDPRVKGQITIISARPVTTTAAYQIFLSALKAQGFTAVEGIGVTKIVPTTEAKANAEVNLQGEPRGGERIMTHVLVVQHTSATQMIPLLRPLMSPTSQLSAYDQANALIITDYADNIRRMMRIVEKIDQPVSSDVTIITLRHASALDLADLVTRLSLPGASSPGQPTQPGQPPGGVGGAGDRFNIVPDLRTNSLLVRADNPGRVNQIRSLIDKLDVPALSGGQTRVIYLRNADAVKLAEVLRGLLAGEARTQTAAAATPTAAGLRPTGTSGKVAEASLIQADEATNALIINAQDATYNNLRGVIEKLDVRRTQVYVEALIVEMQTDAAQELGVQWAGGVPAGSGAVAGIQNFPSANPSLIGAVASPTTAFANAGGLLLGFLGERVTLPDGTVIRGLGALARALETRGLANILSTPNLMTLDNAEAKIVVGQNVPFVTGSFAQATGTTTGAAVNPFQTIERKDVGLTLKIKPQVSEGGTIKMDIYQEVSNVALTSVSGASDLVTNKRSIDTKVLVDDGHTIILGGLIEDNKSESEQSVPLLGRLPLIGGLFRYKSKTGKRTNLMVFLRPVIIHGPQESFSVTSDRYLYLRARTQDVGRQDVLDRFAPTQPTPEELKKFKKRSDNADQPREPAAKPSADAPADAKPADAPPAVTD